MDELKETIKAFIHKYLEVSVDDEDVIANYVLRTWQPLSNETNYLQFVGKPNTGKTRAGLLMYGLCKNPMATAGYAPMALLKRMELNFPVTAIIDVDAYGSARSAARKQILKILHVGYHHSGLMAAFNYGKSYVARVFGYKVVLSRSVFRDPSLRARCVTIHLGGLTRNDIPANLHSLSYEVEVAHLWSILAARYS